MYHPLDEKAVACILNKCEKSVQKPCNLLTTKPVTDNQLEIFKNFIGTKYNQQFDSYWDLHRWSVKNFPEFWKELWHYFSIIASNPYDEVFRKTGDGFLDNEWFKGASFNLAENIMRIKDDRIGIICSDEMGNRETITYVEIYKQVKLYAAAFRKHGLSSGDRVAYYISNIKEALFAMLATVSIGAIWGGPLPFYGSRMASSIMKVLDPKLIISVDHFQAYGEIYNPIDSLPFIVKELSNIEKVIIVPTRKETLQRDLSNIPNSIFLDDFLKSGMATCGEVPDLKFEQLPFNYPTIINFTSGTTGDPKGVVHSAGAILAQLRDFALHLNLKEGDVVFTHSPVGWAVWDYMIPNLALGVTLFLFNGSPEYIGNFNIWDTFKENRVTFALMAPTYIDVFASKSIIPRAILDSLKIIGLTGSAIRPQDYKFLLNNVKKDLIIASIYGATETMGTFSSCDLNSSFYECECQVPSLGVDLHIFEEKGNSVIGKRGEVVITTPNPALPVYLWNDEKNLKMNKEYFSKHPGVWCQNDEGWINPITKGLRLIGRSDNTIKQHGERLNSNDIYFAISEVEELEDYICVGQERPDGTSRAVLFVKLKEGYSFTPQLKEKVKENTWKELDIAPEVILEIPDIPYNLNRKRMESLVKKIITTNKIPEVKNVKNPECLKYYCDIPQLVKFNKMDS
ncbi:acetoacetyl-CoA synthetase-like [Argiope bruennichi]|uniref:acetoacetyl-CoA synthetase-like n=1 Tax=Argiope bruennichi TaxID=94029 RepID=UPI002493D2C6|nr:acetoacetyl-CoA synthetase-like [Argiope bruennichi]